MALAGAPLMAIMAHGRWKTAESVARYVETPQHISELVAPMMATTEAQRMMQGGRTERGVWHTHPEGEPVLMSGAHCKAAAQRIWGRYRS